MNIIEWVLTNVSTCDITTIIKTLHFFILQRVHFRSRFPTPPQPQAATLLSACSGTSHKWNNTLWTLASSIFLFSIFFDTVITWLNVSEVDSSLLLSSILGHKHKNLFVDLGMDI